MVSQGELNQQKWTNAIEVARSPNEPSNKTFINNNDTILVDFLRNQKETFIKKKKRENINNTNEKNNTKQKFRTEKKAIMICIQNIKGINKSTDQDLLIEELKEKDIDIMGLSETKLTEANDRWAFHDHKNQYKCITSSNPENPFGAGTIVLIKE